MGVTGQTTAKPTVTTKPPTRAAAPAPSRTPVRSSTGFAASKPRGARSQLEPVDDFTAGVYTIKVNRLERIMRAESKHPQPCESSIIELEVVSSNVPKCPPGYTASATFTDRYFQDLYFSDVKGFLCALLNAEPEQVDDADWASVFGNEEGTDDERLAELSKSSAQFNGNLVNVTVKYKLREGKHPITLYVWTPNPEQHPDQA